jgi:hypothetical protein
MSLIQDKYLHYPNLLPFTTVLSILHGPVTYQKTLSSQRRVEKTWEGIRKIDYQFERCVKLTDGRIDISLPVDLGRKFLPPPSMLNLLACMPPGVSVRNYNLLLTPPGSTAQDYHQDNGSLSPEEYYMALIPLNAAEGFGKTELLLPYSYDFPDLPTRFTPAADVGDALVLSGCLWHRGTANTSKSWRYSLYVLFSSAGALEETW